MKNRIHGLLRALLVIFCLVAATAHAAKWNYRIGEAAPDFQLTTLDGKTIALADYKGKIVVMSFMTSWCPFCNAAAPHLQQIGTDYADRGVTTLIVDVHEEKTPISEFVTKHI